MRIALIDDHHLLIESLGKVLMQHPSVEDLRFYTSGESFFEENSVSMPDVIVTDLKMPGINGVKVLETCREIYHGKAKVIVLSSITDVQTIKHSIRAGALGFISKSAPMDELIEAILTVAEGKQYIDRELRDILVGSVFTEEQVVFHLSPREKEVLQKVCSGKTIKEVAYELKISTHTAQYYHRCIMSKFKINRTADLIVFAIQHGLYIPDLNQQ